MGHVEDEITPFLKARRAALDPAELGLPDGPGRRRVRGLRREEVAQRAGISVDYYTRIEQGRAPAISDSVLDAVARALRLSAAEHTYLRNITMPHRRSNACGEAPRPRVRPQVQELLDAMGETVPAIVVDVAMDVLAWNRLAALVQFDYDALPPSELNAARLMFTHPESRSRYPDWADLIEDTVANLRAAIGRSPDQPRLHRVIWQLREEPGVPRTVGATVGAGGQQRHEAHHSPGGRRAGADLRGVRPAGGSGTAAVHLHGAEGVADGGTPAGPHGTGDGVKSGAAAAITGSGRRADRAPLRGYRLTPTKTVQGPLISF